MGTISSEQYKQRIRIRPTDYGAECDGKDCDVWEGQTVEGGEPCAVMIYGIMTRDAEPVEVNEPMLIVPTRYCD